MDDKGAPATETEKIDAENAVSLIENTYRTALGELRRRLRPVFDDASFILSVDGESRPFASPALEVLSLGKISSPAFSLDGAKEAAQAIGDDVLRASWAREILGEWGRQIRIVSDLCCIWSWGLCGLCVSRPDESAGEVTLDAYVELARKVGVGEAIDAYLSGVPVEDIIA